MARAASQRAARNPTAPSRGCRGPIRFFGSNRRAFENLDAVRHQSQMAAVNNAVGLVE
jgi:hypothetical protein